jgi:DnaJ-class molecular chaperone
MSKKDYYQILSVERSASPEQIKQAYRKLAFEYHPDRNQNPTMHEKMKEINEAYAVLSNETRRKEYDFLRAQYGSFASDRYRQSHTADDIFRGSDINQIFEEFARTFGFRSFNDIFREAYGDEYRSFEFRRPGMFGSGFVFYQGARRSKGQQRMSGPQFQMPQLPFSGISGKVAKFFLKKVAGVELPERGKDWRDKISLAADNALSGTEQEYYYKKWGKPKNLMVTIPPFTKDGQWIKLKGMGGPGRGGGEQGDLYLQIQIKKPLSQKIKNLFKSQ